MKNLKIVALLIAVMMVIGLLAGCGAAKQEAAQQAPAADQKAADQPKAEEPKKEAAPAQKIKIGTSMQGLDAPYVVSVKKHLEAAFKNYPDVEATILDGEAKPEKQVSQVENFIAQKVNSIIMNPIAFDGCAPAVDAANKANIPIVTLITLVKNEDKVQAHSGSDHKESGLIEAEMVAKFMGGKGNIVVIEGVMGIDAQIKRMEGYKEVLAKYPDIKIVAQGTAAWQRDKALALVENWMQSGKQFSVVLSQNDNMAMGALKAIEDAKKADQIKVFGIDGDNDALQAVKDGRLQGTVFQDAKGQAEKAAECAYKLAKGEKVEKMNIIPFKGIDKSNIGDFLK